MGGIGTALGSVGSALGNVAGTIGQQTGLTQLGQGLQSLFGGGESGLQPPGELVGPPSPYAPSAGGFLQGLAQGFTGTLQNLSDQPLAPSAALGGGLGQLLGFIDRQRSAQGEGGLGQIVNLASPLLPGTPSPFARRMPAQPPLPNITPEAGIIARYISGLTGGILRGS